MHGARPQPHLLQRVGAAGAPSYSKLGHGGGAIGRSGSESVLVFFYRKPHSLTRDGGGGILGRIYQTEGGERAQVVHFCANNSGYNIGGGGGGWRMGGRGGRWWWRRWWEERWICEAQQRMSSARPQSRLCKVSILCRRRAGGRSKRSYLLCVTTIPRRMSLQLISLVLISPVFLLFHTRLFRGDRRQPA